MKLKKNLPEELNIEHFERIENNTGLRIIKTDTIKVKTDELYTILDIKQEISRQKGFEIEAQRLFIGGTELEDTLTLTELVSKYSINRNSGKMMLHVRDPRNLAQKKEKNRKKTLAPETKGGSKKVRKHQGIYQRGPKKGKLKPGFKYSGKKTKTGLKIIVKVKK